MKSEITRLNLKSSLSGNSLKVLAAVWTLVIFAPFIYSPRVSAFTGHPWRVELIFSFIFTAFLAYQLFENGKFKYSTAISPQIFSNIILPFAALILWSAVSGLWANSGLSVIHHTLVWACYLIFFIFALKIVSNKELFRLSLLSLGLVIGIICTCSIIEFYSKEVIELHYAKISEIYAALLPLFLSFALRLKRKHFFWSFFVSLSLLLGVIVSLSRGALAASIISLTIFFLFRAFAEKTPVEKKRLAFAIPIIIFVILLTQIPLAPKNTDQKTNTFSRLAVQDKKDPANSISSNARFLFAGVAKEMVAANLFTGVGADNFGLEFNKYRIIFSAKPENSQLANLMEEFLPQRAHNEYLQILAELGAFGGLIFVWLLGGIFKLGLSQIKRNKYQQTSFLIHAAVSGLTAFLFSSLFSSFSFRLMQNGLVFFFLAAILLKNFSGSEDTKKQNDFLIGTALKTKLVSLSLIICLSLLIFSASKATSQFFVSQAEDTENLKLAKNYYETAIRIDPANATANYSFALRLFDAGNYQESADQLQQTTEKGINASVNYSQLITTQILANQFEKALETSVESVEIFPHSVFLRIRYAVLLKTFGFKSESEKQFAIAVQIDEKQAETWWLTISQGPLATSREARVNDEVLNLNELKPNEGVYTILTDEQIISSNEKIKNNFDFLSRENDVSE